MVKPYILILFLFLTTSIFSQEREIHGVVLDKDGQTMANVQVISFYPKKTIVLSNFEGVFTLKIGLQKQFIYFQDSDLGVDSLFIPVNLPSEYSVSFKFQLKVIDIGPIIISVGKFDKPIEDQTVSLEIIKPELIASKNTRSIETILDQTPGLNILDGEPQIRGGSGFTFGVGAKVAVLVDDIPMLSGDAGRPEWGFIPVENIQQIEVIKGAASVLSGSAALSGSINIRTAYPGIKPISKITIYSGLYSTPKQENTKWYSYIPLISGVNFLHSEKKGVWDIVLGGNYNYDHGYIGPPKTDSLVQEDTVSNFSNKQMASQRGRFNFQISRKLTHFKNVQVGVNGNAMLSKTNMVFAWLGDSSNLYRAYPGALFLQTQKIFHVDPFITIFGKKAKHFLRTRYLQTNNDLSANQSNASKLFYSDYQFKKKNFYLLNSDFITGITAMYTLSNASIFSGSGNPKNSLLNLSHYAQLERKFKEKINLSVGYRIEYFELNDSTKAFKPIFRSGISYKAHLATFIRASFGQGYRFPTIAERFIKTGIGNFGVFSNPNLKAESSWNAEIGIKQGVKIKTFKGFLDIAYFWQEYQNTIEYMFGVWDVSSPTSFAGFKFLNTGNSRVRGIDASLMGEIEFKNKSKIQGIIAYNYILPQTLSPDFIYATDQFNRDFSYNSTSLDSSSKILKYRFLHNFKMDLEWKNKQFSFGVSLKYFSKIINMDKIVKEFEEFTQQAPYIQDIQYMNYFNRNRSGSIIFDGRIAYNFKEKHTFSIVSANLFNNSYSLRPLKIESPRTIMFQYILKW